MASQYFYQKQMGPRRTPPPRKTSLIEINGAVPDISMLSDCLGNNRVDTNGDKYSESHHGFEPRVEYTNRYVEHEQPSEGNLIRNKEQFQSKERFHDRTPHPLPPSACGDSKSPETHLYDNHTKSGHQTQRQESPAQNDPDFERECIDSYQKWRAKNAALFATPESGTHTERSLTHKMISSNHDARIEPNCKSVQLKDHFQSPDKSTLDKYYEYFKRDQAPRNKQFDNGDYTHVRDVAVYGEKNVPHQISSKDAHFQFDPRFRVPEELESAKYCEYYKNKPIPYRNEYLSENFTHEKGITGYIREENMRHTDPLKACCDSPRCEKQRRPLDEDYKLYFNKVDPWSGRKHLEEDVDLRESVRNRGHDEFNRTKKVSCSKSSGSKKKLKKSPVPKNREGIRNDCFCPECDDNYDESLDLVKYKKSKNSSRCCRKEADESDSSLDRFPKRSCKNSRKRNAFSFEDLCQFVKLQNEQILLIQKQVDKIGQKVDVIAQKVGKLELQNKSPVTTKSGDRRKSVEKMEKCGCNCEKDNKAPSFKLSVVKENSQIECLQAMENHNGVSIGVMTSCVEIMQKAQIGPKNACQKRNDCEENHGTYSDNDQPNSIVKKTGEKRKKKKKPPKKQQMRSPPTYRKHQREVSAVSDSFNLNEGELHVFREPTPSPEPSIHIDIEEFSSSSSSSGAPSDDESEPNANCNSWDTNTDSEDLKMGWTLYNNIVGQVNNILQNPPPSTENQKPMAAPSPEDVRKATLEQLRLLGVNLGEVDNTISKKVTFNHQLYPREEIPKEDSDPGIHLNALAKMYLRQEQFHEGTSRKELTDNIRTGNTNLSHATLCYLEKYKIKPGSANRDKRFEAADNNPIVTDIPKPQPRRLHHNNNHHSHPQQHHYPSSRILDITELKQQPKLL